MELSRRSFLKLSMAVPAAAAMGIPLVASVAFPIAAPVEATGRVMQGWMDSLAVSPAGRNVIVGAGAGMLRETKDIFGVFYANDGDVLLPIQGPEQYAVVRLGEGQARLAAVDELRESDMLLARVYDSGAGLAVEDRREWVRMEWGVDYSHGELYGDPTPDIVFGGDHATL